MFGIEYIGRRKMYLLAAESVWSQYSCTISKAIAKKIKSKYGDKKCSKFEWF